LHPDDRDDRCRDREVQDAGLGLAGLRFVGLNPLQVHGRGLVFLFSLGELRAFFRSEEHTSELQSRFDLVCRLLLEKKKLYTLLLSPRCARTRPHAASFVRPGLRVPFRLLAYVPILTTPSIPPIRIP